MNELALFAGAGGGLLASRLLGWSTVCAVEIEPYCHKVLMQRQRDGMLEHFPIWDDVRTFDGRPWRGLVDVVSGGFPCQDISVAGQGDGLAGKRSGLWFEYQRIVDEVRPAFVFIENSPALRTRGLGTIIEGLAPLGYDTRWCVLGAWHLGAPHKRDRMWVLAHADSDSASERGEYATCSCACKRRGYQLGRCGCDRGKGCSGIARKTRANVAHAYGSGRKEQRRTCEGAPQHEATQCGGGWPPEPPLGRVADGYPGRVDELKAIGNMQVPRVAAAAFHILRSGGG